MNVEICSCTADGGRSPAALLDARDGHLIGEIYRVLDEIHDPCSTAMSIPMGLAEMGLIKHVHVSTGGHVEVTLRLTSPFCEMIGFMKTEAIRRVGALEGVAEVAVNHDSGLDWDHDLIAPQAQQRRRLRLETLRRLVEEDAHSEMVTTRPRGGAAREDSRT